MKRFLLLFLMVFVNITLASPCFAIKIGLQTNVDKIYIGSTTEAKLIDVNTNRTVCDLEPMKGYEIRPYHNTMAIRLKGQYYKINSDNIVLRSTGGGLISAKNKWYKGHFIIRNTGGNITVINDINIEEYVKGVVPAEMPSSWEIEALKAQAIAARSYAMANLGKQSRLGYDLKDNTEDQAYNGATAETEKTNKAVDLTKGIVLIYDLKIIPAFYYASAGGQTASANDAWGKDLPYIRSVPSFDDEIKKNGHGVGMSQHGANNLAKPGYNAYQILQYFYKNIRFARLNDGAPGMGQNVAQSL